MAILLSLSPKAQGAFQPEVSARCAIVIHSDGEALYEKNADQPALIASTTKLMTALLTLENAGLQEQVEIKSEYCAVEGSNMGLKAGDSYTVEELLLGLLLASGNDAALALAHHVSGSEAEFVLLMNRKASELSMEHSSFANPHGLDAKKHYSTAKDMAKLMCACMAEGEFRRLCGTKEGLAGEERLSNHNKLLDICPGCIAGKTGYTMAAGRCLVSCCGRNGAELICVTLAAPDDWNDHIRLYDWAFGAYGNREITAGLDFTVPVLSGDRQRTRVIPTKELVLFLPKAEEITLRADLPRFVFAPIRSGETAGTLFVIMAGETIASCPLAYTEDIEPAQPCRGQQWIMEML